MYQNTPVDFASILLAAQQYRANQQQQRLADLQMQQLERRIQTEQEKSQIAEDLRNNPQLLNESLGYARRSEPRTSEPMTERWKAPSGPPQQVGVSAGVAPRDTSAIVDRGIARAKADGAFSVGDSPQMLTQLQAAAPEYVKAAKEEERSRTVFGLRARAAQGDGRALDMLAQTAPDDPWLKQQIDSNKRAEDVLLKLGVSQPWLVAANQVGGPMTMQRAIFLQSPEGAKELAKIDAKLEERNKSIGTNITIGDRSSLSMGQKGDVQKEWRINQDTLYNLNMIRKVMDKGEPTRFVGMWNRAGNWLLSIRDYVNDPTLSKDQKELVGDALVFREANEQIFNRYRVMVTGAAASMKELEMIRNSMLNTGLSPSEYEASFRRLEDFARRADWVTRKLLSEGIPTNDPGYGAMFDQMMQDATDAYISSKTESAKAPKAAAAKPPTVTVKQGVQDLNDEELDRMLEAQGGR